MFDPLCVINIFLIPLVMVYMHKKITGSRQMGNFEFFCRYVFVVAVISAAMRIVSDQWYKIFGYRLPATGPEYTVVVTALLFILFAIWIVAARFIKVELVIEDEK